MPTTNSMHRAALVAAAAVGGAMVAMIIDIMLARRGIGLVGAWQGIVRSGGTPLRAAVAWWVITVASFVAGLVIAAVASRFSWLYLRSLRWVVVCVLTIGLAMIGDLAPPTEAAAATHQALVTLGALTIALVMAGFGAFFAVRR
jgi:hypothetical protein